MTFGGAVDWSSIQQKLTAQSTTHAKYSACGVGCIRLTQISHLLKKLGIPTIPHVFYNSQSMIASIEIKSTVVLRWHTLRPSTILQQIWLEMERSTWDTYKLLRCLRTAPQSHPEARWLEAVCCDGNNWSWTEELSRDWNWDWSWTLSGRGHQNCNSEWHQQWCQKTYCFGKFVSRRSTMFQWLDRSVVYHFVWNECERHCAGALSWLGVQISPMQGLKCNLPLLK